MEKNLPNSNDIFSKVLRAGRRTYFFDVRETRAGDYYLTITESKKNIKEDGSFDYKKHKIYLYKEDFSKFHELFKEASSFILDEKGEEVISDRHQSDWNEKKLEEKNDEIEDSTQINFDDI
ncbi:MAG: PUR family DNA/RNA-binding protein [Flavobacteriales bacterium]